VATIVGVPLFEEDLAGLKVRQNQAEEKLALLPRAVRKRKQEVKDDF
jgi:hypothetical protein